MCESKLLNWHQEKKWTHYDGKVKSCCAKANALEDHCQEDFVKTVCGLQDSKSICRKKAVSFGYPRE